MSDCSILTLASMNLMVLAQEEVETEMQVKIPRKSSIKHVRILISVYIIEMNDKL